MARSVNIAGIGWVVGFASSVDSAALPQAAKEFGVSEVTESLATGLFLVGFGCGTPPLLFQSKSDVVRSLRINVA